MAATEGPEPMSLRSDRLLVAGVLAGPVYVGVAGLQILFREGFDVRVHAVSLLANGPGGWIQIANFLVTGGLVMAGAAGLRRRLRTGRGRLWGPLLLWVYGIGLAGSGVFPADPGSGFPPGTEAPEGGMTRSGLLHFVFGGFGFYALIGACFVFGARFAGNGRRLAAGGSVATGVLFAVAFAFIASGSISPVTMLGLYGAVLLSWIWHSSLMAAARRGI